MKLNLYWSIKKRSTDNTIQDIGIQIKLKALMIKIGLTGGIGSGKTTISSIFRLLGCPIYIADHRSKFLTEKSPIIRNELTKLLGEAIYTNNKLNKNLLASIIFTDSKILEKVNNIIHPVVRHDFETWLKQQSPDTPIVLETAILLESKFDKLVDFVINVYSPLEERIAHCMQRDNTSEDEVKRRITKQMSDEERNRYADVVIVNDNHHSLIEQVQNIFNTINQSKNDKK